MPAGEATRATTTSAPNTMSAANTNTATTATAPRGGTAALKKQLGGMSYAAGAAALAPTPTSTPSAASTSAPAAAAAPAPLAPRARQEAYTALRQQGTNPAWMNALQAALGVDETGVASFATIDAIAARQVAAGQKRGLGMLDRATVSALEAVSPDLAKTPRNVAAAALENARGGQVASAGRGAPEDDAVRSLGIARSYSDYAQRVLKNGRFLNQTITAHPEMHARLANAVAYLKTRFVRFSEEEIGERLGIHTTSSFRASTATSDQMHHGTGFAIDLNPQQNNWLFLGTSESSMGYAMERAGVLFDSPTIQSGAQMWKNANSMDTEQLVAQMQDSNDLLIRYRDMCRDKAAIRAYFDSPDCPAKAKARGLAYWLDKMPADEGRVAKWLVGKDGKPSEDAGFMDLKEATISAMRDAAGLRWGGADLGNDNGDLMHFDGHNIATAATIRGATAVARQQRAAEAAAAAAAKK